LLIVGIIHLTTLSDKVVAVGAVTSVCWNVQVETIVCMNTTC